MANPSFIITDAGLAAASVATPTGPYIHITQFKVGTAFGYTPDHTDTALHGSVLYTGVPFSYTIVANDTLDILLLMDETVGPFNFGEVGLYLDGGVLFALAAFTQAQQKLSSIGNQVGSRWFCHCYLKLTQAPAIIQVDVTNMAGLLEVPSWDQLAPPISQLSHANAAIIHEADPLGQHPIVVRKSDLDWTIYKYTHYQDGVVGGTSTPSVINATVFSSKLFDPTTNRRYLIKMLNTGLIRSIQSISGNNATLNVGFPSTPSGGFEVWQSDSLANCCPAWASGYEYNTLVNLYNPVWSTPNGMVSPPNNVGWNQTAIPLVTKPPTISDWTTLINDVIDGAKLVGQNFASVVVDDFKACCDDPNMYGLATKKTWYDALVTCLNAVVTNHNNADPTATFLETNTPASGTRSRNVAWNTITHIIDVTYTDANTMYATFNGGGRISAFAATAGGSPTPEDVDWQNIFTKMGTVRMNYNSTDFTGPGSGSGITVTGSAIGFFQLTSSYQTLLTATGPGVSAGVLTWKMEGKLVSTSPALVRIQITFDTQPAGPYATAVTLTSTTVYTRPSSTVINQPVLAFPTTTSSGTM